MPAQPGRWRGHVARARCLWDGRAPRAHGMRLVLVELHLRISVRVAIVASRYVELRSWRGARRPQARSRRRVDLRDLAVLAGTDLDGERVAPPRDRSMTRATRHAALRRELPSTADPGRRDRTGGGRDKRSSASGDVPRRGPHPEGRTDEGRPGGDEGCRRDAAMTQGRPLKQPGTLRPRARTK